MSTSDALLIALETARQELLDRSTRNRLLNTARGATRSTRLEIVDEKSAEVFRRLVADRKSMSFLPVPEADEAEGQAEGEESEQTPLLVQPDDDPPTANGVSTRHKDDKLQTQLTSEQLQKRLLKLFYDARTYEEEQGVNLLYLALGFLKWYEDDKSDRPRFAPLLLVPVTIERQSAGARFKIRYTDEDIATNLSLQARLKDDFGIALPEVPDSEELVPSDYYRAVADAVAAQPRWEILPDDMVLWFFSFAKFLMYRDLQPENWPEHQKLEDHSLIRAILREGFGEEPPLYGDDDKIDQVLHPRDMIHVLDADSSQALAVEETRRGRNLVIQGPPGTGKSQTIANMIAAAVKAGKTVLFVAEKMAALDVVRRRLGNIGLGDMCLELHSSKANKRAVLQDLERTQSLGQPQVQDVERHSVELAACREQLNTHLQLIHTPLVPAGMTPYQVVGELVRLRVRQTAPPEFQLADPLNWSSVQWQAKLNLLRDLVEHVAVIGVPEQHPWRGVALEAVLPSDVERLQQKLPALITRCQGLSTAGSQLAELLGTEAPATAEELDRLVRLAKQLAIAPPLDAQSLGSPAWKERRQQLEQLVAAGTQYTAIRKKLAGTVMEAGWDLDMAPARRDLASHGRSWFRLLFPAYREAQATLRGILVGLPPSELDERLGILDHLLQGQKARNFLAAEANDALGRQAFGSAWNSLASDWTALAAILRWEAECREARIDPRFREIYARLGSKPDAQALVKQIEAELRTVVAELQSLFASLKLNSLEAFRAATASAIPWADLAARLQQWREQPEALSRWVAYQLRRDRVAAEGMAALAAELQDGRTAAAEAVPRCEMAYYEALIRNTFRQHPALAAFHGESHEQLLNNFRTLDQSRIVLARREVAAAHFERLPRGDLGDMRVLRHQFQLQRRHMPIRKLLRQAGAAVKAIKPVFMMSPISVAQYLEPGAIEFDLLLVDEASQVQPVDALGALARAKQVVVVGDSKQLPPTRFFSRMGSEEGQDETQEAEVQVADIESILGLCCSEGLPQRMLRWHYRSRHHSLIAVSNHEFYDDRLFVVPSPGAPALGQGLTFHYVADGVFDRGGTATNRVEAHAVAAAVMAHARQHPDKSLGVGAFSVAQRDAILDELEVLRRSQAELEPFFVTAKPDPFFVKNLENIQGDERDVIFISVGYGKSESGSLAMNFGPLSNDGGERRLNVLITRARECCTVFSSIHADDIDVARGQARGTRALKTFLKYAETGLLDTGSPGGREHDSEFERQVALALAAQGYQVEPQVGVTGFYIDLAIVDPTTPGRYLLGVECDGANYYRSRSARDRDRLREAVLRDRGWLLHRIWSTDWFQRPDEELRKTLAAIERAKIEWAARATADPQETVPPADNPPAASVECSVQTVAAEPVGPAEPAAPDAIVRDADITAVASAASSSSSQPYVVASFRINTSREIHEVPAAELARVVLKIIEVEGPIHGEEVVRRVTQLWGLRRAGRRIRDAVSQAIQAAAHNARVRCDHDFYRLSSQQELPIRDRGAVSVPTLRRPEMLPPEEVRQAVVAIVEVNVGVSREEVVTQAARLFGFQVTSLQLRQVLEAELDAALAQGQLEEKSGKLFTKPAHS